MRRAGYKKGFLTGLCLYASGALLFWPAALIGSYYFFLFALFVIASGLSFLETASNPFIAQLGDPGCPKGVLISRRHLILWDRLPVF